MSYTIVGVIGHIDHGKTSLVAALTGVDTDTHPEEKRRGITIDLGFASFAAGDHQFALIDAPGHQKYIGNLLAGVSGIDVGLLVVACDQGIQAQTLEHASILQMLGVKRLIVALSRIDLATAEAQTELREELEVFLDDFDFSDIPMIPISSVKNIGLDVLTAKLCEYADAIEAPVAGSYFRMPVDRVFTMPGRGCVIAGTVWGGSVNVGDNLELAASGEVVRIREVEVHGEAVQTSKIGYRTALNVTGVSASEVSRGDELIQPGVFRKSRHLLVELRTFHDAPEIKCPATMQLHIAASACSARITGVRRLQPSQSVVVVVETDVPVVAAFGQKCLFRLPYPVGTVGGATVLAVAGQETKRTRRLIELGEKIAMSGAAGRLVAWAEFLGEVEPKPEWMELQLGIPAAVAGATISTVLDTGDVLQLPKTTRLVSASGVERIKRHVVELLTKHAEETQDAWVVEESAIQQSKSFGSPELIRWCVKLLVDDGTIVQLGRVIAVASDQNSLSKKQQVRMEKIVAEFEGNRSPPALKDISDRLQLPIETVTSLTRFAVQTGMLLDTGNGLLLSASVFTEFCNELHELFAEVAERPVADIRDRWQVTRKHAIPFLEFCDRMNVTRRNENMRTAGEALPRFVSVSDA
jgi:selenocysteine-specific elongation factor